LTALLLSTAIACSPLAALAAKDMPKDDKAEIEQMIRQIKEQSDKLSQQEDALIKQQKELLKQQQALEQRRKDFEKLQSKFAAFANVSLKDLGAMRGTGEKKPAAAAIDSKYSPSAGPQEAAVPAGNEATAKSDDPEADEEEVHDPNAIGIDRKPKPEDKPPEIAANIEEGGVLLKKGKAVLIPSLEYTRSSATRVAIEGFSVIPAINIGRFQITQVGRDTITAAVQGRLGVTNRFEIDAKVPYLYRSDTTRGRPIGVGASEEITSEVTGNDIGDVEVGAHYQINRGRGGWPFMIANLRFKTVTGTGPFDVPTDPTTGFQTELPTGSGFYALQPSMTFLYPSDPAVFYSNIGYLANFKKDFGGTIGEIDPGDSISASMGMSVSLNDNASFSLGYSHNTVFETDRNGTSIPNGATLEIGTLDFGYAYSLTENIGLNFSISAGVTEDAPDSRVIFRVPLSLDLF